MKLYRVHKYSETDGSFGFSWHTSKRAAERAAVLEQTEWDPAVETVEFEPTLRGILALLNWVASHPDNG